MSVYDLIDELRILANKYKDEKMSIEIEKLCEKAEKKHARDMHQAILDRNWE